MTALRLGLAAAALIAVAGDARSRTPIAWVSEDNYPPEAARAAIEGRVAVAFDLNTDGRISDCTIRRSSGHLLLDAESCSILTERARFAPAVDARGRPRLSRQNLLFRWRIGEDGGESRSDFGGAIPLDPQNWVRAVDYPGINRSGVVVMTFTITARGRLIDCRVAQSSGHEELDRRSCAILAERGRFIPASDGAGGVRATTGRTHIEWRTR